MLARTLVLTFHGIGDPIVPLAPGEGRYFITAETWRRTIRALAGLEAAHNVRIRVTFDDGNLSDYATGLPALAEAGRDASFFVLAGRIGKKGYLSGEQIRAMIAAGMRIGSHGWDHVDWRNLDEAGRRREIHDARRRIEDEAGVPVTEAAIPFGAFDKDVLRHLKEAGYSRVYTSTMGMSYDSAWFCPRWSVTESFDPDRDIAPRLGLRQILRGTAYAPLRRLRYRI
jgi:peptidoglycan/xylan/chitin deacetylase (PgdA/CDA1 family)